MCNCVWLCWVWILSGKKSVPVSARRSLQVPLLSENQETGWVFESDTHEKKHSNYPSGSLNVTSRPPPCWRRPRCLDLRVRQSDYVSWTLDRTCVKLRATVKKQILCISLSLCCTSGRRQKGSIVLGVCEGCERVDSVSEGGLVCTHVHLFAFAFLLFLPLLFHMVSSSLPPCVPFYHSSCKC